MKMMIRLTLTAAAAVFFAACGATPENKPVVTNVAPTNTNTAAPVPAFPTKETFVDMEKKAFEAWKNKDGKFFETFVTDNFVSFGANGPTGKADLIKGITDSKCTVASYSFSDEKMTQAGPDAAIITMKVTLDETCDGKKQPSPVTTASVYTRVGGEWKGAYHNEVPIVDPKAAATTKPGARAAKADNANEKVIKPENAAYTLPAAPGADDLTETMLAAEKAGWEAWKARDAAKLGELTSKDLSAVDIFGTLTPTKADTIKVWTEQKCDIKSFDLTDAKGVALARDATLLTFKGNAVGTCEGQKLVPQWSTSVFVKEAGAWKLLFMFQTKA